MYGHFITRATQTWLVCADCNQRLIETDTRATAQPAFIAYQATVEPVLSRQLPKQLGELARGDA